MIVLVKERNEVTQGQYTNLEVKGINTAKGTETTQTIFSALSDKWGLVQVDKVVELVMKKKGEYWNVIDIKPAPTEGSGEPSVDTKVIERSASKADMPQPAPKPQSKNIAFALSYAKDLAVAGKIEKEMILLRAELFRRYLDGEIDFGADIEKVMGIYVEASIRKEIKQEEK